MHGEDNCSDTEIQARKSTKFYGYFATKKEALQALAEYNKKGYDIDRRKITFAQLYEEWSDKHFMEISKSSVDGYKTAYKRCEKIHNMRFADLRTVHLQKVVDEIDKYSIKKSVKILLGVLYNYAMENDIADKRYSKFIKLGKPVKVYDREPFSDEEIQQKLWDNVDKIPFVDVVLILIYTGMRITELLEVGNENVHLDKDNRYIIGGKKTDAGKDRVIPIAKKILPLIKARYNKKNKFLITENGKPITYSHFREFIWIPLMEQLEMNHTIHETRHTTATLLSNAIDRKSVV